MHHIYLLNTQIWEIIIDVTIYFLFIKDFDTAYYFIRLCRGCLHDWYKIHHFRRFTGYWQDYKFITLKPVLIYLYRRKTEDAIAYLEKKRGIEFLEYIYERDKKEPFYENHPSGGEGMRQFLRHYGCWVNNLYEAAPCKKMNLDLSKEQWSRYEEEQLSFLNLENLQSSKAQCRYSGTYRNEEMDTEIKIEKGDLIDCWGNHRKLIPKSNCEFYIYNLPITIKFINQDNIQIEGQQLNERWTTVGANYSSLQN